MDGLPLPGVVGAAIGVMVGLLDYGIVAALVRRWMERNPRAVGAGRADLVMKVLFVVNAVAFAMLGWWVGMSTAGIGVVPPA